MNAKSTQFRATRWRDLRASGAMGSLFIAGLFFVATTGILMLRQDVVPYRPGQFVRHNITSRVDFDFPDADQYARLQEKAREEEPRVYVATSDDYWGALADELVTLPDRTYGRQPSELPADLRHILDPGDISTLNRFHERDREKFDQSVWRYVQQVSQKLTIGDNPLVILPASDRDQDLNRTAPTGEIFERFVTLRPRETATSDQPDAAAVAHNLSVVRVATDTYSTDLPPEVLAQLRNLANVFPLSLQPAIAQLAFAYLQQHPTHELDPVATKAAQERAVANVSPSDAAEHYLHDAVIVSQGVISYRNWQVLRAENQAFQKNEDAAWIKQLGGTALIVMCLTIILSAYVARYQPRVVRNHLRAATLAALIVAMLLLSALAVGSDSLYFFGICPTILAAIILTIAYDQRFAIGVGTLQAILVTAALNQSLSFFVILIVGMLVACFMLNDVRSRSKLIEVGGAAALAMIVVTAAGGLMSLDVIRYVAHNCLYAGAAGLAAGFVTLGILPFIERTFRITTSMTLLELADATQPLLRRLALEAPGTYNHSLQVATLAEAAAEAIGANALACRVGAYYHDIGKINKADYFQENQLGGGPSRHLNLSPSVSLLIIIGHVKDGMELARQYNLPPSIMQFIQQHHGTTLVEYFYDQACKLGGPDSKDVQETQYRYPGPKPKSRETAVMMLSDCVECACRAMTNPSAAKVQSLVHELTLRRLHDGQFDECDLTMRDLEMIQRALVKMLMGIYHGRVAYPSMSDYQSPAPKQTPAESAPATSRKLA